MTDLYVGVITLMVIGIILFLVTGIFNVYSVKHKRKINKLYASNVQGVIDYDSAIQDVVHYTNAIAQSFEEKNPDGSEAIIFRQYAKEIHRKFSLSK